MTNNLIKKIILPIIVFKAYAACTDLNALDNDASMTAS